MEPKSPPPVEKSLNSISWNIKTLVEELKKINENLNKMASNIKDPF